MFNKKFNKNESNQSDKNYACTIRFLDDSEPLSFAYQKETRGQEIFDQVCHCLDLVERDYFGLRYISHDKQRHWLDLLKPVYRQLKLVDPVILCFRVKFYPSDPLKIKEEITRYFIFLQLRRDLHHGRLLCSQNDANLLAAFIIQSEMGDYDSATHPIDYVSKFKMLPQQSHKQEEKIAEMHASLAGNTAAEVELQFLLKSATLDTYGIDPHPVKDNNGNLTYLGVNHLGVVTFQGVKKTRVFTWPQVKKITFEGKMFIVHVTITEKGTGLFDSGQPMTRRHVFGYKCPTIKSCKHLWRCAIEQQCFFTLDSAKHVPKVVSGGGVFSRSSRFKFSGRCEKETYRMEFHDRDEPRFIRTSANPLFTQRCSSLRSGSVPATFNQIGLSQESLDSLNNYRHGGNWRSMENISRSSSPQPLYHDDFSHNGQYEPDINNNNNNITNNNNLNNSFSLFDSFHNDTSSFLGAKDTKYHHDNPENLYKNGHVSIETQDSSSSARHRRAFRHQPRPLFEEQDYNNNNNNNLYNNNNNLYNNNNNNLYNNNNNNLYANINSLNYNHSFSSNINPYSNYNLNNNLYNNKNNKLNNNNNKISNNTGLLHVASVVVLVMLVVVISFIIYVELHSEGIDL